MILPIIVSDKFDQEARYRSEMVMIDALQIGPQDRIISKLRGLRPLSPLERVDWKYRDNSRVHRKPLRGRSI